jgi:hypothetical protein
MPKKRRQVHIPQQQSTRKRRVARRPEFAPVPEPEERVDLDGNPIFADDVVVPTPAYDATGPVETRPQWIAGPSRPQRQPGRRMAQLRGGPATQGPGAARILAGQLPTFERGYLREELRRIAITAGSLFALIIVLGILMR